MRDKALKSINNIGKEGEDIAVEFCKKKGYRILERNFRTVFGEIDIIAQDGGSIVFLEVKTRADDAFGYPFEAVTPKKREKMRKVALYFLKRQKKDIHARFDVLSIFLKNGKKQVEHIQDAFEV